MYCTRCGTTFPDVYVYCPECGQEAHMVSQEELLEEDFLKEIIDEDEKSGKRSLQRRVVPYKTKSREYERKKRQEEKRRRRIIRNLIIVLVIIAALIAGGLGWFTYSRNHSVDYLMTKAEEAYETKDYTTALTALHKILDMDPENVDALLLTGSIDTITKDYEESEALLFKVLELDASNIDAYRALIQLYDQQDRRDLILKLREQTNNTEILALFENYIVPVPEADMEGGTYSDDLTITITAPNKKLDIYYTLDGTDPQKKGTLYEDPIELTEEGEYKLVCVCKDEEGYFSDPYEATYKITFNAPPMPKASPDGGQFDSPARIDITVPEGTTVHFTWDGSVPDEDSPEVKDYLTVKEGNHVLSLIAIDKHGMKSEVLKCNYIYYPEVESKNDSQESSEGENTSQDITVDTNGVVETDAGQDYDIPE